MPTYEYNCKNCNKNFTQFQSISSQPFLNCPDCSSKSKRIISSGSGVIFKGSGFYVTDYKNKKTTKKINKVTPKETKKKTA